RRPAGLVGGEGKPGGGAFVSHPDRRDPVQVKETGDPSAALQIEDLVEGSGAAAQRGQQLEVLYTLWLFDPREPGHKGRKIDSTDQHGGVPFGFRLGAGQVIKGWDAGVEGMKIGGKRRLVVQIGR